MRNHVVLIVSIIDGLNFVRLALLTLSWLVHRPSKFAAHRHVMSIAQLVGRLTA